MIGGHGHGHGQGDGNSGRALAWAITTTIVVMLAWLLRESWPVIVDMLTGAKWYMMAASIIALSLANIQVGVVFTAIARRSSAASLRSRPVLGVFLMSQVAKYVPGRVWGVAMQAAMLRSSGSAAAVIAANIELSILTLAIVSGVGLASLAGWSSGWFVALAVLLGTFGVGVAMLRLNTSTRFLRFATRLIPGIARLMPGGSTHEALSEEDTRKFEHGPSASLAAYIALYLLGWWLMVISVSMIGPHEALAVVAAMSLSYIVGALSMLPGGLGAREGAMIFLAPSIGLTYEEMAALALVSRAVLLMIDILTAAIGAWLLRREFF